MTDNHPSKLWYQSGLDVFLNNWFSNYAEARASFEQRGGFLLPYQTHFFICQGDMIRALGLDPDDPDWEKIGHDCARPRDADAFARLREKRERVVRAASETDR